MIRLAGSGHGCGRDREDEINMHASGPGMRPLFPEADQEVPQNDPFLDTLFFGCFGNTPFLGCTIFSVPDDPIGSFGPSIFKMAGSGV